MALMPLALMASEGATLKQWVIGGIIGGAAGFSLAYLLKGPYTKWRQEHGFDESHLIHHGTAGTSIAMLGGVVSNQSKYGPVITGFGVGMTAEDYAHHAGLIGFPKVELFDYAAEESSDALVSEHASNIEYHNIPNWPASVRNAQMVELIRSIIYEDSHHPAVRKYAEAIIKIVAQDGREEDAILRGFQRYILDNVYYVHDESRAPDGSRATDRYQHAYITLPESKYNPEGAACGDCDDLAIAFSAMCLSVGFEDIGLCLVDQNGKGYTHIAPVRVVSMGKPTSINDCDFIELTEERPYGWVPAAKKYGIVRL